MQNRQNEILNASFYHINGVIFKYSIHIFMYKVLLLDEGQYAKTNLHHEGLHLTLNWICRSETENKNIVFIKRGLIIFVSS